MSVVTCHCRRRFCDLFIMNSKEELSEESDSSDEDYNPGKNPEEVVSEVESDGDPEDNLSENEDLNGKRKKPSKKKASKKQKKTDEKYDNSNFLETPKEVTDEEKKKKEDDLWADFMKDTGFQSKKSSESISSQVDPKSDKSGIDYKSNLPKRAVEKVKVTQVFEFAGEEVAVEKEVAADSAEARLLSKPAATGTKLKSGNKGGLSGISAVLNHLGKKPKISTLEKSKLDWDKFKKEENLQEELQTYNKGKDGYLERQDFLQRADLRRFEIEKEIRTIERNRRMNN